MQLSATILLMKMYIFQLNKYERTRETIRKSQCVSKYTETYYITKLFEYVYKLGVVFCRSYSRIIKLKRDLMQSSPFYYF